MSRKDLQHTIATKMLAGPGLEVLKRTNETMLADAMKAGDADAVEALGKVRGDLRKLAEQKGGGV